MLLLKQLHLVKVAIIAAIFASSKGFQPSISHSLLPQQFGVNHIGRCRNPTLAKCEGEAQHLEKLRN